MVVEECPEDTWEIQGAEVLCHECSGVWRWLEKWMSWSKGDFAVIGCLLIRMTIDKLIQVVAELFAFFHIHVVWSFWSWWLARCFHHIRLLIIEIPRWVAICCCSCSQRGHCDSLVSTGPFVLLLFLLDLSEGCVEYSALVELWMVMVLKILAQTAVCHRQFSSKR